MNSKEQFQSTPKKNNKTKVLLAATAISIAGAVSGQNAATIDPKYYSTSNPYEIPNLPNGSTMNLVVKTGASFKSVISGADNGSLRIFTPDGRELLNVSDFEINKPGTRTLTYKENGTERAIAMIVEYQADIYGPKGDRPNVVFGDNVRLSGGPNMGYYKWKEVNDASYTGGYTDSVKVENAGRRVVLRTNDGNGYRSNDTIDISTNGTPNNNSRSIEFEGNKLITGRKYHFYKFNEAQTIGNDSVWSEEASLAFTADGNNHSVPTGVGIWRIGMEDEDGNVVKDEQSQKVTFTTDVLDVSDRSATFTQKNNTLERNEKVEYWIYDITGKIIDSGYNNTATINNKKGIFIVKSKADDNKNVDIKKIVVN